MKPSYMFRTVPQSTSLTHVVCPGSKKKYVIRTNVHITSSAIIKTNMEIIIIVFGKNTVLN